MDKRIYHELEKINDTYRSIQELLDSIPKIAIPMNEQLKTIYDQCEALKHMLPQIPENVALINTKILSENSVCQSFEAINNRLKLAFNQTYLSINFLSYLKAGQFKQSIFDAIPDNIPTIVKNLHKSTIKYFKTIPDIQFNLETKKFELYGIEFNDKDINNFPILSDYNPDFTTKYIANLIYEFKENELTFSTTKYYNDLLQYTKNKLFYTTINNRYFYRGVKNNEKTLFDESRIRNKEYGYSPMGRYNLAGKNYLYVSDKILGTKVEILKHNQDADYIQLAKFENNDLLTVFNIDNKHINSTLKKQLKKKITINTNKTIQNEYILSAILSECIKSNQLAAGIKYSEKKYNCFVFYNTSLFKYENMGIFEINNTIFNN